MDAVNYAEFSRKLYDDFSKHERNIQEFCTNVSLVSLADFHLGYKEEIDLINSEVTPSKDNTNNTIQDFADIFKAFDEYPANLHKLRKSAPARDQQLQRHNSTIVARNTPSHSQHTMEEASGTIDLAAYPTASETRKDFKKFQAKLQQLLCELRRTGVAEHYKMKMENLEWFSLQLEKLSPSLGAELPRVFTDSEEETLNAMVSYTDDLNFLLTNADVFQNFEPYNGRCEHYNSRLEKLMDVVAYTLSSVAVYNM